MKNYKIILLNGYENVLFHLNWWDYFCNSNFFLKSIVCIIRLFSLSLLRLFISRRNIPFEIQPYTLLLSLCLLYCQSPHLNRRNNLLLYRLCFVNLSLFFIRCLDWYWIWKIIRNIHFFLLNWMIFIGFRKFIENVKPSLLFTIFGTYLHWYIFKWVNIASGFLGTKILLLLFIFFFLKLLRFRAIFKSNCCEFIKSLGFHLIALLISRLS